MDLRSSSRSVCRGACLRVRTSRRAGNCCNIQSRFACASMFLSDQGQPYRCINSGVINGPHLESVGSRRPLCICVWSALAVKSRPRLPTSVTRPPVRPTPAIADNFSTTIRVNLNGPLVVRQKLHVGGFPSERRAFPHGDG